MLSTLLLLCACTKEPDATWHLVNVNATELQGDANLIQTPNSVIMIDGGYYGEAEKHVIPYVTALGIKAIDHFFVSHPHRDHYEGLIALLDAGITVSNLHIRIPPKHICDREIPWGCNMKDIRSFLQKAIDHGISIHHPEAGFLYQVTPNSTIEILHAQDDDLPTGTIDVNDLSLIMKWSINDTTVLFTGDLNDKVGTVLSSDPRMRSDFLKMPHHGATGIAPNEFFDQVDPGYVLVPGPKWIWCGERGAQARDWVEQKQLPVWINGIDGNIKVDFFDDRIVITPEIDSKECKLHAFGRMEVWLKNNEL
ncbi:MAG: MBL fold metallo-hydrolase [Pseudomonadota bacterium]|nr:MBL fold metallo-hydrolase [Pseudomonadota bacterium]